MPRKSSQTSDDSDNSTSSSSSSSSSNSSNTTSSTTQSSGSSRTILLYIVVIVLIAIIAFVAYTIVSGGIGKLSLGGGPTSAVNTLSNTSTAGLNTTQTLFINDLKKSLGVTNLYVGYYSSNATNYIKQSSTVTIAISSNQTVDSYKLGNENRTTITGIVAYTNENNSEQISKNVSSLYYYNTNETVLCYNDTTYTAGLVDNSTLECGTGDQGLSYIEDTPFTAANVSSLSYLVYNNSVSYGGTKTIAGRTCDSFVISNETGANLESNYSVFDLCLDTQYGVPLYMNETDVVYGTPSSFSFTATGLSTNVTASEMTIPQAYINAIPKSII